MVRFNGNPFMKTQGLFMGMAMVMLIISCKTTAPTIGVSSGNLAPEITATGISDITIKLSDYKGKLVLLEFWDSQSSVARRNHFEIQRMYQKFKTTSFKEGKGFEIFSLSIDNNTEAWKTAVKEDGIAWPVIVNDPKAWNSSAVLDYKIAALPKYFLINESGIIINHNIIISDLEKILNGLKD